MSLPPNTKKGSKWRKLRTIQKAIEPVSERNTSHVCKIFWQIWAVQNMILCFDGIRDNVCTPTRRRVKDDSVAREGLSISCIDPWALNRHICAERFQVCVLVVIQAVQ
jgi:hypothetical protein